MKKILFIIFLFYSIVSCNNSENKTLSTELVENPSTIDNPQAEDGPVLKFDKKEHNFGHTTQGEKLSYTFKFKNEGNKDLIISQATASCGCTVAQFTTEPVKPKEEGYVSVSFSSAGLKGPQDKMVTIFSNATPTQSVVKIKAMVELP